MKLMMAHFTIVQNFMQCKINASDTNSFYKVENIVGKVPAISIFSFTRNFSSVSCLGLNGQCYRFNLLAYDLDLLKLIEWCFTPLLTVFQSYSL